MFKKKIKPTITKITETQLTLYSITIDLRIIELFYTSQAVLMTDMRIMLSSNKKL